MLDNFLTISKIINSVQIKDLFDIAIVGAIIYFTLIFIKETRSFFIFNAIIVLFTVAYLSEFFNLQVTNQLLQPFLTFLLLILVIVFQREIRRFFEWFAISGRRLALQKHLSISEEVTRTIVRTVHLLISKKMGAIIVFEGEHPLEHSIERGEKIDSRVSVPLLLSIFDTSSPGHDGAVIISHNRIKNFGVHLPLAQNSQGSELTGTRHRASLGLAEETDALVLVVSEESGAVSLAYNGALKEVSKDKLKKTINSFIRLKVKDAKERENIWHYLLVKNWIEKIFSLVFAIILWFLIAL